MSALRAGIPDVTDSGDTAWLNVSSALVFLMTPALAFFYGGLVNEKAVISTMMMSFATLSAVSITWSLIGYSLAFGPGSGSTSAWIGDSHFGFFDSRDRQRDGTDVPEHAYMIFQLMFAIITAAVVSGSVAGRMRLGPWTLFSTLWNFFVYIPLARWVFYSGGWLAQWGVLDFAGGIPVETASGVSALVLAFWLDRHQRLLDEKEDGDGDRRVSTESDGLEHGLIVNSSAETDNLISKKSSEKEHPVPHNVPFILLGAGLLFFGWFGFNAGSAISSGYLSSRAFANTHLAAAAAMAGWAFSEVTWGGGPNSKFFQGKPSAVGCATGVVVGLVAITPACGFVSQMFALFIGFFAAPTSFWAMRLMHYIKIDDTLECFPGHGVAGMFGIIATGFFASTAEGSPADGLVYGNPSLLGKQIAAIGVALITCFIGTSLAFWLTSGICKLFKAELTVEHEHIDMHQLGEQAYSYTALTPKGSSR